MRLKKKEILGIILSFVLVLGLMPGMRMTANAEGQVITCTGTEGNLLKMFEGSGITYTLGTGMNEAQFYKNGKFTAPEGKCFTKIVLKSFDGNGSWSSWNGRALTVTHTGAIVVNTEPGSEYEKKIVLDFTVDDLAKYNVTLNTNGGTVNDGNISTYTEFKGATLPTNVTRKGYIFEGWYDNAELTGEPVTSIASDATGNKEYWAKWEPDPNADSSSGGDSSDNTNTDTDTSAKVPYDDVPISTGSVKDITGTAAATAESNPFGTKIENNSNLNTLLSLTDAEVAQGVNVWLDVQDMSSSVPQKDKTLIQDKSGNYTVGLYLDINLFKKVGGNDATKVTETNGKVKASIVIPESLRKSGRTFEIIRVHDGVATAIAGTYDEKTHVFTFETDKFSTYALAYNDSAVAGGTTNSTVSTSPKTGDPNDVRVWYLLLIASLGGLGFLGYSKKKVND